MTLDVCARARLLRRAVYLKRRFGKWSSFHEAHADSGYGKSGAGMGLRGDRDPERKRQGTGSKSCGEGANPPQNALE